MLRQTKAQLSGYWLVCCWYADDETPSNRYLVARSGSSVFTLDQRMQMGSRVGLASKKCKDHRPWKNYPVEIMRYILGRVTVCTFVIFQVLQNVSSVSC